jgi:glycerophosphoryl diester phosphodiesterase
VLVVRHENEIGGTTDMADRPEFANRKTTKIIDGESFTGWFTEDFTLAELKSLRARERLPQWRGTAHDGAYDIPTFEEVLIWLAKVNEGRAKAIGVYPETKHPSYFAQIGLPHEAPLLRLLAQYGYQGPDAPVYIQSFEVGNLQALRQKSDLPLIQLMSRDGHPADRPDLSYAQMRTPAGLREIARYANGIGAEKNLVLPVTEDGRLAAPTPLVADAKAAHLAVHVWTVRRENIFLPPSLRSSDHPAEHGDVAREIAAFLQAGVAGIFSDNVAEAYAARQGFVE